MKKYKNFTLQQYLENLSQKTSVPGGGSAAALTGALGVALISMVARYSVGKGKSRRIEDKLKRIIKQSEDLRKELLLLVDADAKAYAKLVAAKKKSPAAIQKACREARVIPQRVCRICYKAVRLTPFLVKTGNQNLIQDIQIAAELLLSAFNAALVLV